MKIELELTKLPLDFTDFLNLSIFKWYGRYATKVAFFGANFRWTNKKFSINFLSDKWKVDFIDEISAETTNFKTSIQYLTKLTPNQASLTKKRKKCL